MVATALCLTVLIGCSKTETPPSENKPQGTAPNVKGRKDRALPPTPEPIKVP
jgi:hypothetical protein